MTISIWPLFFCRLHFCLLVYYNNIKVPLTSAGGVKLRTAGKMSVEHISKKKKVIQISFSFASPFVVSLLQVEPDYIVIFEDARVIREEEGVPGCGNLVIQYLQVIS